MGVDNKALSLARLSEKGQLTIPAEYRPTHHLERDSALVIIEIGDALVLIPRDEAVAAVTARLEVALKGAGANTDDLIKATANARAEITQDEVGDAAGDAR